MSHYEKIKLDALERGIKYIAEQKGVSNANAEDLVCYYCVVIWQENFQPPNDLKWAIDVLTEDPGLLTRDADSPTYHTVHSTLVDVIAQDVIRDIMPRLTEVAVAVGFAPFAADELHP